MWLQAKSTGQLSIFVFVMNFGGCLARIFTSIQEGGGIAMVRAYIIGTSANTCQQRNLFSSFWGTEIRCHCCSAGAVLNFTLMAQIL